jgi:hypothetical protein
MLLEGVPVLISTFQGWGLTIIQFFITMLLLIGILYLLKLSQPLIKQILRH